MVGRVVVGRGGGWRSGGWRSGVCMCRLKKSYRIVCLCVC